MMVTLREGNQWLSLAGVPMVAVIRGTKWQENPILDISRYPNLYVFLLMFPESMLKATTYCV
jgi:hypothetical protein